MTAITFNTPTLDTLFFSNRMQKVGMQKIVADELAEAINDSQTQALKGVATKEDIKLLKTDIKMLEKDLKKDIQMLEKDLTIKLGRIVYISTALIITTIGLAVAVIKL